MKTSWPLLGIQLFFVIRILAQKPIAYASNPLMNLDTLSPSPELKTMLLQNLNKHSNGEGELETLGNSKYRGASSISATALPLALDLFKPMANTETTTLATSVDEMPFNVVQNFFDEEVSLPKSAAFASNPLQTPSTPLLGFGELLKPLNPFTLPTLPPLRPFATLPPLITLPPLLYLENQSRQQKSLSDTVNPITDSPPKPLQVSGPRFVNQSTSAVSPEHVQMWRRRFYKVFKEIKNQFKKTVNSDSDETNPVQTFKTDSNWEAIRKPVEEDAISKAQEISDKTRMGPFQIEHSGYAYNDENKNNGKLTVNRETPFASLNKKQQPLLQNRSNLLSEFAPNFKTATSKLPFRLQVSNDYDEETSHNMAPQIDDDTNLEEEPCQAVGCMRGLWHVQRDADNRETCNSLRLKVVIENSIVAADAEQSKRIIQTRTETEFGTFYNVICGTGFFSYIAHTDEFCLATRDDMNCYVFSPVCADLGISNDLVQRNRRLLELRQKALKMNLRRHKTAYVNRN